MTAVKMFRMLDQGLLVLVGSAALLYKDQAAGWIAVLLVLVGIRVNRVLWKLEDERVDPR